MAEQKKDPATKERQAPKELRDLKPKKDVKGGGQNSKKGGGSRPPGSKGEVDFMGWD